MDSIAEKNKKSTSGRGYFLFLNDDGGSGGSGGQGEVQTLDKADDV